MDKAKLAIEVEVGPRFEIFYALHKLFAPASSSTEKWRTAARARLGARVEREATEIVPEPLMWAVLADSTLGTETVTSFDDLMAAVDGPDAEQFRAIVLAGVPDIRGSALGDRFRALLRYPHEYRGRMIAVLHAFWSSGFAEDFSAIKIELDRTGRQLLAARASAAPSALMDRLSLPIELNETDEMLKAGRSGYSVALARVGRITLLPSAFNLNRWWTKRDYGEAPVDFFFPLNDSTITPNDAFRENSARPPTALAAVSANLRPELVFRALGDTTRYAIATILARSPSTPSELARQLRVSKPTITHHVHALRDAGLIVEGTSGGKLALDRSKLEGLSAAAVSVLFSSEGKLRLAKTRKR